MHRRIVLLTLLILVIVNVSVYHAVLAEEQLFKRTRVTIPNNLPWYFLVIFGDNRPSDTSSITLPVIFREIIDEIHILYPLAVIGTGDHTGKGTKAQIDELYDFLVKNDLENIWLAIGNHDKSSGQISYWIEKIAPENYFIDDIPSWRIAIINSETDLTSWRNQLKNALGTASNRNVILVFHRPAYPYVEHNLDPNKISALIEMIETYDHVRLVLEGHWHGYGYQVTGGIMWLVTGGAGAPLHSYPTHPYGNAVLVLHKNHYVVLILYPNGTFKVTPILAGRAGGKITIKKVGRSTIQIQNTKVDIFGKPTAIPVRLKINCGKWIVYSVVIVPPKSSVSINYEVHDETLRVSCNAQTWFSYAIPVNQTYTKAVVGIPHNGIAEIKLPGIQQISLEDGQKSIRRYAPIVISAVLTAVGILVYLLVLKRRTIA